MGTRAPKRHVIRLRRDSNQDRKVWVRRGVVHEPGANPCKIPDTFKETNLAGYDAPREFGRP
jgi:hypothetical protein